MKFKIKLFCLLLVISSSVTDASAYSVENYNATVNVTFRVDMSAVDTHAQGVYLAGGDFGQDGHLMADGGNDIWSVTVSLNVNQRYLYKFRNQPSFGTWDGFEDPADLITGGCGTGDYNDRFVEVAEVDITLDVVLYGSCTGEAPTTPGCTDVAAVNYNADSTEDDGSCVPSAPVPTAAAEDVLSIFSDAYTNVEGTDFNPGWGQATQVTVGNVLTYSGLDYQGTQFANQDVSAYGYLHVDYYTTNATNLNFFLISPGAETGYALEITTGEWNSVDIPLTSYSSVVSLSDVYQFKVVGNGDVYLDNLYFGGAAPAPVPGCTDTAAENYNAEASQDDGSCTYNSTAYCSTQVTHLNIEAETSSAVFLTIENVDANTVEVSATSADADLIDVLFVGGQSNPASEISATSIVDGTASFTLTWNDGAPAVTSFEILWSKESMGGNWMLNRDQLSAINTADACPEVPVIPGCTDATRCNYNSAATNDDGTCLPALDGICESCSGEADGTGTIVDNDADDDGICDIDEVHIVEFTDVKMEIYPNPVTDQLHLIMNDNFNRLNIEVVNPLGVSLIHKEMKDIALGSVMEFDIDHLPKGMYVLKVSTHRERITTIPWMKQ